MTESIVKPLEWRIVLKQGWNVHTAAGLGCTYECAAKVWNSGWMWGRVEDDSNFDAEDEEAAKSAAQADYEQRILSALSPSVPALQAEVARLREALETIATSFHGSNPSLAYADVPREDYLAHVLYEARKFARTALEPRT